jgi:hypothetical protein
MPVSPLDVWPLYGPPRQDGEELNVRDCLTTPKETLLCFVGLIYPAFKLPGGSWLYSFLRYIWPENDSRNRAWVETVGLPKALWPYVSHAGQGGVRTILEDVPSSLHLTAIDWAKKTPNVMHWLNENVLNIHVISDGGFLAMYYLFGSIMTTEARRAMLCNACLDHKVPGYLILREPYAGSCKCGQPVAAALTCHHCGILYCFVCAQKRNCADWTVWPPRPLPTTLT